MRMQKHHRLLKPVLKLFQAYGQTAMSKFPERDPNYLRHDDNRTIVESTLTEKCRNGQALKIIQSVICFNLMLKFIMVILFHLFDHYNSRKTMEILTWFQVETIHFTTLGPIFGYFPRG